MTTKEESKEWLEAFADRLFSYYAKTDYSDPEFGTPLELLVSCAERGGFPTDIEYGDDCQPDEEFWAHYENYTGKTVKPKPAYFRCAC